MLEKEKKGKNKIIMEKIVESKSKEKEWMKKIFRKGKKWIGQKEDREKGKE